MDKQKATEAVPDFKTYRVLRVTGRNVRNLVEFDIIPPPNGLVVIAGKNGGGKSSVVDGMLMPLGGGDKSQIDMIRKGQEEMEVTTDCGDFIAHRLVSRAKNVLVVKQADGEPQDKPAAFLSGIRSDLSIDPLAFAGMTDKERAALLMQVAGVADEIEGYDSKIAAWKESRKEFNKANRDAVGRLRGKNAPEHDVPSVKLTMGDLIAERKAAQLVADQNTAAGRKLMESEDAVEAAREKLEAAQRYVQECEQRFDDLDIQSREMPDDGLDAVDAKIAKIEETNGAIEQANAYRADAKVRDESKAEMDRVDTTVRKLEGDKRRVLEGAVLPVDGLTFEGEGTRYNGVAFDQISFSERVRAGMKLAMAANKQLRVVRIEQGGELDDDTKAEVDKLGKECDYQVWCEQPGARADACVTVADGRAVNV